MKKEESKGLAQVLAFYAKEEMPTLINSRGDNLIKPPYRRKMKQNLEEALRWELARLIAAEDPDLAEVVVNYDGLMIVAANEYEGCYTIEIQVKVKNLDYDAYELLQEDEGEDKRESEGR